MTDFTENQIQTVIDWMNAWEQLRGTVIPIRFKEDFTKQTDVEKVKQDLLNLLDKLSKLIKANN